MSVTQRLNTMGPGSDLKEYLVYIFGTRSLRPVGHWQSRFPGKKPTFKGIPGQTLIDMGYCDDLD